MNKITRLVFVDFFSHLAILLLMKYTRETFFTAEEGESELESDPATFRCTTNWFWREETSRPGDCSTSVICISILSYPHWSSLCHGCVREGEPVIFLFFLECQQKKTKTDKKLWLWWLKWMIKSIDCPLEREKKKEIQENEKTAPELPLSEKKSIIMRIWGLKSCHEFCF